MAWQQMCGKRLVCVLCVRVLRSTSTFVIKMKTFFCFWYNGELPTNCPSSPLLSLVDACTNVRNSCSCSTNIFLSFFADSTHCTGFSAIKLTALGKPSLLVRLICRERDKKKPCLTVLFSLLSVSTLLAPTVRSDSSSSPLLPGDQRAGGLHYRREGHAGGLREKVL